MEQRCCTVSDHLGHFETVIWCFRDSAFEAMSLGHQDVGLVQIPSHSEIQFQLLAASLLFEPLGNAAARGDIRGIFVVNVIKRGTIGTNWSPGTPSFCAWAAVKATVKMDFVAVRSPALAGVFNKRDSWQPLVVFLFMFL